MIAKPGSWVFAVISRIGDQPRITGRKSLMVNDL